MQYRDEFETRKDVMKFLFDGIKLYFVPTKDGKYGFCTKNQTSEQKRIQEWMNKVTNKEVPLNQTPFVIRDAFLKGLGYSTDKAQDIQRRGFGAMYGYAAQNGIRIEKKASKTAQNKGGNSLTDKVKAFDWAHSPEVSKKFNELFHIPEDAWKQTVVPNGGSSIVTRTLTYKDKKYSGTGSDKKSATRSAILDFLEKEYGVTVKADLAKQKEEAERRAAQERQEELLDETKYLKVLSERSDVTIKPTSWINPARPAKGPRIPANSFLIDTPYGKQELTDSDISLTMIKAASVSKEERESYNQRIEEDKEKLIERLEREEGERRYWIEYEKQQKEKAKAEAEKAEAERRARELVAQRKREEVDKLSFSVIEKATNDNDHRTYVLQDDKGSQYKLTVDYGDIKVVDREHHPDWDRYDYGYKTAKVEHQHFEKPMRTLTVAYEKIGGKEDEKFALSAAVEPEAFAKNPLSIDLVFGANLNQTITQKQNKDNALFLRKLLKESKDPINASPKKFKEQQTFKGR